MNEVYFVKRELNLFPNDKSWTFSKLKDFAVHNFRFDENGRTFSKRVKNDVGKGEIARYEQFLLFPQHFPNTFTPDTSRPWLVWEKVNAFSKKKKKKIDLYIYINQYQACTVCTGLPGPKLFDICKFPHVSSQVTTHFKIVCNLDTVKLDKRNVQTTRTYNLFYLSSFPYNFIVSLYRDL